MMTPLRILHITESYGGGVAAAIDEYVESDRLDEHHLLRNVRIGDFLESARDRVRMASVRELPSRPSDAIGTIRRAVCDLRPDVVHLHSSIAGGLGRIALTGDCDVAIVYTPHCFAFERRDIGFARQALFRVVESLLARRTDVIAACSEREKYLASHFPVRGQVVFVPNVAAGSQATTAPSSGHDSVIMTTGRVGAQKDPRFFIEVMENLDTAKLESAWVGFGADGLVRELKGAGVKVTGWLTREDARKLIAGAAVYVHTALWEGFPMAVLEACAVGMPIVVRNIPAFHGAPREWMGETPQAVAALVRAVIESPDRRRENLIAWRAYLAVNNRAAQTQALHDAYSSALESYAARRNGR